jgi:AraC-like DNA-binding protein
MLRQADYLDKLHDKADSYVQQLDTQRTITWLACGVIVLLLTALVLLYLYYIGRINLQRERVVNTLWNINPEDIVTTTPPTAEVTAETPADVAPAAPDEPLFITRFKEVVESRLTDSELSVEDLAADMNLSRVQLYRKVKAISGSTPIELLRSARLSRAYQMLITTDKTVSEVAYEVGFTAPSYFTKCFKDEYGLLPGEARK